MKPYLRCDDNGDNYLNANYLLKEEYYTVFYTILEALSYEANLHTNGQVHPDNDHMFQQSRRKELDGLTTNRLFLL